jgi:hypothetical protein
MSIQITLNNLQHQINTLKGVNGLTNPLTEDINAATYKMTNLSSIGLKDGSTNRAITIADSVLEIDGAPYGNVSNPLTANLDCGDHSLSNVSALSFTGQESSIYLDAGVITFTHEVEFGGNNVGDIGEIACQNVDINGGDLTYVAPNLRIANDLVLTAANISGNIPTTFTKITVGTSPNQFTFGVNPTNNLALYTGTVVQPSDLVGEVAYISADNGLTTDIVTFTDTADSANHKLMLSSSTPYRLQIDGKQIMIEDDMTNYYSKDADINTQHDIYMNGHNIANIGELGIGLSQNKVLTLDGDDDLTFDENKIVTSANIAGYIDGSNIFQQVYKDSYLTDFNPSYTTYEMHIDLTPELAGQTPTLGYSVFIRGHLNAIVLARLPSGSDTVIGNECFDYELLVFGTGRSWSFNVDSVTAHNPYVHTDGTQHELTFTADPDNDNSIICTLNFEGINQNKIMNSYSVVVNRF